MLRFLFRRFLSLLLLLFVASLLIFLLLEILPGDAALVSLGTEGDAETLAALRREAGLDRPFYERYIGWISGFVRGDWGESWTYGRPVRGLILERLPLSLSLALLAMGFTCIAGIALGVVSAVRQDGWVDRSFMLAGHCLMAVPGFWLGILLALLFAVNLGWFPSGGFSGWQDGILPVLHSLVLPVLALGPPQAVILMRIVRTTLLETMHRPFMLTAEAKGHSRVRAILHHALRNTLVIIATLIGMQLAFLFAGVIVIENVFYLPGIGRLAFQAVLQRDLVVLRSLILFFVMIVAIINFAVDVFAGLADPRIRDKANA